MPKDKWPPYPSEGAIPSANVLKRMTPERRAIAYERLVATQYGNPKGSRIRAIANGRMWTIAILTQDERDATLSKGGSK